jgi:integrase
LGTDSLKSALRRLHLVASQIEAEFEHARLNMGVAVDQALLQPISIDYHSVSAPSSQSLTLSDAYERYMNDPTHSWSARTREAYETSRKLAVSVIGADTTLNELSRVHLRDYIDVLRFLPKNASKRFPKLTAREAAAKARADGDENVMTAANANVCIANLSSFLNWAVNEELLDRNPVRGLRLVDDVSKRDKRHPFSAEQLRKIFHAPLYTGCVDGERGYALEGDQRPRNARFWVPLIGLHTGMRLNEICQLDVADIRQIDGFHCIVVTDHSDVGSTDKQLKTTSSERMIPVHRNLTECGFLAYVELLRRDGVSKLFGEIDAGAKGIRSIAFSKWFTQFLRRCGANKERTCFHSFRHNFRDELRAANVNHDVAMRLGGWTGIGSGKGGASENYGHGHRIQTLHDSINLLQFSDIDLSHLKILNEK